MKEKCKFGMHWLANGFAIKKKKLVAFLELCKSQGVNLVEIPVSGIGDLPSAELIAPFKRAGMEVALCVFFALPNDPNPALDGQEAAFVKLQEAVQLAKQFTEAGVKCHGIVGPWAIKIGEPGTAALAEVFMKRVIKEIAEPNQVLCCFEPLRATEDLVIASTANMVDICKRIASQYLAIHLDTFHAQLNDDDVARAIRTAGAWLRYVHASGTLRSIPGDSEPDSNDTIVWPEVGEALEEIDYEGVVTTECFGEEAEKELPEIADGLSTSRPVGDILEISGYALREAEIIAPLA